MFVRETEKTHSFPSYTTVQQYEKVISTSTDLNLLSIIVLFR